MGISFQYVDGKIVAEKPAFHDVDLAVDNAAQTFAAGRAALLTSTGQPAYGPEEMEAKTVALIEGLRTAFDQALANVDAIRAQALADANATENGDPTRLLTADELAIAGQRRPFVESDLRSLPPAALAARLQSIVTHGDRADRWLYWRACSALVTELASVRSAGLNMTTTDERRAVLHKAAHQLAALVDPDRSDRVQKARLLADAAGHKRFDLIRRRQQLDGTAEHARKATMQQIKTVF